MPKSIFHAARVLGVAGALALSAQSAALAANLGYGDYMGEWAGDFTTTNDVEARLPGVDLTYLGRWNGSSSSGLS